MNIQISAIREMVQVLVRRMGFLQKEGAQCCGISLVQCHIMYEIAKQPGISLNDLADRLGLDNSTMSRHIKTSVNQGYVLNTLSQDDRRFLTLSLTEKGEEIERGFSELMAKYLEELFAQIPEEKKLQVIESIEILANVLGKSPLCCKGPF